MKQNTQIIYKATNQITNKAYVGFTGRGLTKRRQGHYEIANSGSNVYFHRALRKYKKSEWVWEILTECETRKEAGDIEIKLIAKHKTFGKHGYNSTTGGEAGYEMSTETRNKISSKLMGHKHTVNARKKNVEVC